MKPQIPDFLWYCSRLRLWPDPSWIKPLSPALTLPQLDQPVSSDKQRGKWFRHYPQLWPFTSDVNNRWFLKHNSGAEKWKISEDIMFKYNYAKLWNVTVLNYPLTWTELDSKLKNCSWNCGLREDIRLTVKSCLLAYSHWFLYHSITYLNVIWMFPSSLLTH